MTRLAEAPTRKAAAATLDDLISEGKTYLQQGQLDRARETLERALKKSPDAAEAHYWLAKVFLAKNDQEQGIAEFERSVKLAPDNVRLRNELGLTYERADRLAEAEREYQEILRRPTEDEKLTQAVTKRLQLVQARRATEAGDNARALQQYEAALERYPDDWNVVELTAHAYNALGRFKEADALFDRVIKMQPDDAALRFRIAVVYADRGDTERAQEALAKAVELDPKGPVGRAALDRLGLKEGLDLMRENKLDEALKVVKGVLSRVPNDPLTNLNAGILYQRLGRNDDAEAAYKRTLAAAPDNADASLRLGRLYEAEERVDEAIEALEAVVTRAQGSPQGREAQGRLTRLYARKTDALKKSLSTSDKDVERAIQWGQQLFRKNDLDGAQQVLAAVIDREPGNAQAHYWLGQVYIKRRELGEGISGIERSVELAPDNLRLRHELGLAYERANRLEDAQRIYEYILGQPIADEKLMDEVAKRLLLVKARRATEAGDDARAAEEYETLLQQYPDDWNVVELTAHAYNAVGRFKEADALFDRAIEMQPQDVSLRFRVAVVHEARGETERAQEELAKVVELDPQGAVGRSALERLGLKEGLDLMRENKLDQALTVLERVLSRVPNEPLTNLNAGILYQRLGRNAEAEAAYKRTLAAVPDNADASLRLGRLYEATGRVDEAIEALEAVVKRAQGSPQAREAQGRLARLYDQKSRSVAQALESGGGDVEQAVTLGRHLYDSDQGAAAQRVLEAVVGRDASNAEAYFWLAKLYLKAGQQAKGVATMERSARLAPENMRLQEELGAAYERSQQLSEAQQVYEQALGKATDEKIVARLTKRLGLLRARRADASGDKQGALRELQALDEKYPNDPQLMQALALSYENLGQTDQADRLFDSLIAQRPNSVPLRMRRAAELARRKRFPEAEAQYKKVIDIDSTNRTARLNLGRLYIDMGRYEEAFSALGSLRAISRDTPEEKAVDEALALVERDVLDKGKKNLDEGNLDKAQEQFGILLAHDPNNAQGHYWMAKIFKKRQRFQDEITSIERSVELAPDNYRLKMELGRAYFDAALLDKAEVVFNEVLRHDPYTFEASLYLAKIYANRGEETSAEAQIASLLDVGPPEGIRREALDLLGFSRATELMDKQRWEEAETLLQHILSVVPGDYLTLMNLGTVDYRQQRYPQAEDYFRRALEADPEDIETRLRLAKLYEDTDRVDEAVKIYQAIKDEAVGTQQSDAADRRLRSLLSKKADKLVEPLLASDSEVVDVDVEHLIDEGKAILEAGSVDGARKIFEALLKWAPDNAQAHYWLGQVYVKKKKQVDGLILIKRGVELAPTNAEFWAGLGDVYRQAGYAGEARKALDEAVRLAPKNADYWLAIADADTTLGNRQRAQEELAKVVELDPQGAVGRSALERLGLKEGLDLMRENKLDQALTVLERVLSRVPNEPLTNLNAGILYQRLGRNAEAEAAYKRTLAAVPDNADASLRLGRLYEATGRVDEAIEALEAVVKRAQGSPQAREAQGRLARLYDQKSRSVAQALESGGGDVEQAVTLGRHLYDSDQGAAAQRVLEAVVGRDASNAEAYFWLAKLYLKAGQQAKGVATMERSARLAPENMRLQEELGAAYERSQQLSEAQQVYEQALGKATDEKIVARLTKRLGLLRARRADASGDKQGALRELQALDEKYPNDPQLMQALALSYENLGRRKEADSVISSLLALREDDAGLHLRLAGLYLRRGDQENGQAQLVRAVELEPLGPRGRAALDLMGLQRGIDQLRAGQVTDALGIFERILKVVPNDPATNFYAAQAYQRANRLPEAEAAYQRSLDADPGNLAAALDLGKLYQQTNRSDQAIATLERVVSVNRDSPEGKQALAALNNLYQARVDRLKSEQQADALLREYYEVVRVSPENIGAHVNLGMLLQQQGKLDEALAEFEEVLRLNPDNGSVYANIGRLEAQRDNFDQAVDAYARAIALSKDERRVNALVGDLNLALARKLVNDDRPGTALRVLEEQRDTGRANTQLYYYLATIYVQQNELEKAAEAYREAVRLSPNNLAIRYYLAILYERIDEDELALIQYREILKRGEDGNNIVENSRSRERVVARRVRLFVSTLSYALNTGAAYIEQNLVGETASSFNTQLSYNLATNYRPLKNLALALNTGFTYSGDHTNENDSLSPRVSLNGNLNYPNSFYQASGSYNESRNLLQDLYYGSGIGASISGGFRFKYPLAFLNFFRSREDEKPEQGVAEMERSQPPAREVATSGEVPANTALRDALRRAYEKLISDRALEAEIPEDIAKLIPEEEEIVRRHTVVKGDTLWDISKALLHDPLLWPEIWQANPSIENPHLIYPGDEFALFFIGAKPIISVTRAQAPKKEVPPEIKKKKERLVAQAVSEGMRRFQEAVRLYHRGKLREALASFNKILSVVPDDPIVNVYVGDIQRALENFDKAREAYEHALAADPQNIEARLGLAEIGLATAKPDETLAQIAEIRRLTAGVELEPTIKTRLWSLLSGVGALLLAEPDAEKMRVQVIAQGRELIAMGDLETARWLFESLVGRLPEDAEAYYWLAQVLVAQEDLTGARAQLQQSVTLAPEEMRYLLALANIDRQLNRLDDAEAEYQTVSENSTDPELRREAQRSRGMLRAERFAAAGNYNAALAEYLDLAEAFPDDAEILRGAALMYEQLGQLQEAVARYEQVIALKPDDMDLRLHIADLYGRLADQKQLEEQLAQLIDRAPDEKTRREVLSMLGFEKGLELLRQDRLDDALAIFQNILAIVPDDPLVSLNVGIIYQRQQNYQDAEIMFKKVLDKDPRNLTASLRLGLLYAEQGRDDKAIAALERVVFQGDGTEAAKQAAAKLQELEAKRLASLAGDQTLEDVEPELKTVQATLSYNDYRPVAAAVSDTSSYTARLKFTYPSLRYGNWSLEYSFRNTLNDHPYGTDYANLSNGITVSGSRPIPGVAKLYGFLNFTRNYVDYVNTDTNARFALGLDVKRHNVTDNLSLGVQYALDPQLILSAQYSRVKNQSNLPTGFLYRPDGVAIAYQNTSLSDYLSTSYVLSMQFQF